MSEIEMTVVATGLEFPEGPIAMADGSVVLTEIKRRTLSRVRPDGTIEVVAELGGGPNGAAIGPDGACYVTNNGGCFEWRQFGEMTVPGECPPDYDGGRIQRVDLATGESTEIYRQVAGEPLKAPNDLMFDHDGGFWLTDHGATRHRTRDRGGLYYAKADGSAITEAAFPLDSPNGVGLSPDGSTVYAAETHTGRLYAWSLDGPGQVAAAGPGFGGSGGRLVAGLAGMQLFDSLAMEECGNVAVATLGNGGITVISPDGEVVDHVPTGDPVTTNICFGGDDMRTAWITSSMTGRLLRCTWPRPGLRLPHNA